MITREELKENLNNAKLLSSTLMKLDKYFEKYKFRHVITSDCGNIEFRFFPDNNIHIQVCTSKPGESRSTYRAAMLDYQNINSNNSVGSVSVYYSILNRRCSVGYFYDYKIEYPYEHSEEHYFQNLTLYDLPEEFFYEEACDFLQEIKDLEIISMELNMRGLNKELVEAIRNLVHKMEL